MDNKPLESGQMTFNPADKGVPGEGASIKNGAYSVEIAAGKFSVQIDARKKVPLAKGEAAGTPGETDKLVPIEFQEGNLPLEVSGPATKDFDLTSKK
jgi:hypothetical protein